MMTCNPSKTPNLCCKKKKLSKEKLSYFVNKWELPSIIKEKEREKKNEKK